MSDGDHSTKGPAPTGGSKPRRRAPIIDLEATEISSGPSGETKPDTGTPAKADPGETTEASGAAPAPPSEPKSGDTAAARDPTFPTDSRSHPWPFLGSGILGGGIAAAVLAALWFTGWVPLRPVDGAATNALADKLSSLEHQVHDLATRPSPAAQPQSPPEAQRQPLSPELESRLAKLEAEAGAPRSSLIDAKLADRVSVLERRADEAIAAARDAGSEAARAADKAGAEQTAAATNHGAVDALAERVAALEQGAQATDRRLSQAGAAAASDRAVRLGLVAMELRMAVDRGVPFAAELAAVKQLVSDQLVLGPLDAVATTGVSTAAVLAQNLSKLEPSMIKAAGPPPADGILAQLGASAERLVRIRRIDEAPGDDPATVIARAEIKATRGDIAAALAELERLPDAVRAPAADWIRSAQARIAAVDAARQLAASALAALGKPTE